MKIRIEHFHFIFVLLPAFLCP